MTRTMQQLLQRKVYNRQEISKFKHAQPYKEQEKRIRIVITEARLY